MIESITYLPPRLEPGQILNHPQLGPVPVETVFRADRSMVVVHWTDKRKRNVYRYFLTWDTNRAEWLVGERRLYLRLGSAATHHDMGGEG